MACIREGKMTTVGAVLNVGRAQEEGDGAEGCFQVPGLQACCLKHLQGPFHEAFPPFSRPVFPTAAHG